MESPLPAGSKQQPVPGTDPRGVSTLPLPLDWGRQVQRMEEGDHQHAFAAGLQAEVIRATNAENSLRLCRWVLAGGGLARASQRDGGAANQAARASMVRIVYLCAVGFWRRTELLELGGRVTVGGGGGGGGGQQRQPSTQSHSM